MHLQALGKTDGLAMKALEVSAKVEVEALDVLCPLFANPVSSRWKKLLIGLQSISQKARYTAAAQFSDHLLTRSISSWSKLEGDNAFGLWIKTIPEPLLILLAADK